MLLRSLAGRATQRAFARSHPWRIGDLLTWDTRSTRHRARECDRLTHPRDISRTTLHDLGPTLVQATA